ncbi:phosphatase PAP2 family protein [Streptomyces jumonjinensis]|uniref:Phosphatase PAP2 family protein n=1 Tax=Streptomyces jumonjinensis TaxID=1945 RepID=A0A646KFI2_STRJU|nr:phosphatase PAP2 family protein [Streptomyces jumonjinensis]MQS99765.1 phosphatase PAP2 family protein [Streptomyces jumonjinensis]
MSSPRPKPPASPAHRSTAGPVRATAALAAASAVLLTLVAVAWPPLLSFDRWTAETLHRSAVREPGFVHVNRVLTDWVWDPWTMRILIAVAVLWLWQRRERLLAVWVAAATALGALLQTLLKTAVGRERPQWPDPVDSAHLAAFPSGHAMTATVACCLLLWLLRLHGAQGRLWFWSVAAAVVSVIGVGLTRLYLGVHWPTDVLAGWLMGAGWAGFSIVLYERLVRSRRD